MNDSKISKKYHPSASLAGRVIIVCIFLLVIPLLLQTAFLYEKEYEEKLVDAREILKMVGAERANVKPLYITTTGRKIQSPYPIQISLIGANGKLIWQSGALQSGDELVTVAVPIQGSTSHLELAVSKKNIHDLHFSTYLFRFAMLLFFVGGLGGTAVYFFIRRINRPLKQLCQTMERVSTGAAHVRYTPDRMGFEINQLGLQFNNTLDALLSSLEEVAAERTRREKLAEELRIGHEIQESLVPKHVQEFADLEIGTAFIAAKEVNGDFYDLFSLPNGQLLIAICDTAGKGISACLYSLGLRSMLRSIATMDISLGDLVQRVNDLYFLDAHETSMFSTLWLGVYDPHTCKLVYCTQGHPPALLVRGSTLQELWTGGIALGAQKMDAIPVKEVSLMKGDLLVLYTDGITEAHDKGNHLFGRGRLEETVKKNQERPAKQVVKSIMEAVSGFSGTGVQHDDITLLVIKF
jgi:serine phosphatase RsbU (regulator of sigma subunit)